jgi:hypothetical protein
VNEYNQRVEVFAVAADAPHGVIGREEGNDG